MKIFTGFTTGYGLLLVSLVFLLLVLPLLTKDPAIFPDEVFFANTAYSLTHPELFSSVPFNGQLPIIDKNTGQVVYGPIYFWVLAFPLFFFGLSIEAVRLTSVFLGLLSLLAIFFLTKQYSKEIKTGFLMAFLLAIDYNFLRTARFARPEILVYLLTGVALFFYLRTLDNPSPRNYFLTGLFVSMGFFTHFLTGLIAPLTIFCHFLLTKKASFLKEKKIFYLIGPFLISLLAWLFYLKSLPVGLGNTTALIYQKLFPSFYSFKSIMRGDIYIKTLFLMYFLGFFLLLFKSGKNKVKIFWILNSLVTFIVVVFGSLGWYLGLLTLPVYSFLSLCKRDKLWYALILVLIIVNFWEQIRLNYFFSDYSYEEFVQKLAPRLKHNSKVFLRQLIPDPYFYLVKNRRDLKLDYSQFQDYNPESLKKSLSQSNYIVTYGIDEELVALERQRGPLVNAKQTIDYQNLIKAVGSDPVLINYLKENDYEVFFIKESLYHPRIAIFEILNTESE